MSAELLPEYKAKRTLRKGLDCGIGKSWLLDMCLCSICVAETSIVRRR